VLNICSVDEKSYFYQNKQDRHKKLIKSCWNSLLYVKFISDKSNPFDSHLQLSLLSSKPRGPFPGTVSSIPAVIYKLETPGFFSIYPIASERWARLDVFGKTVFHASGIYDDLCILLRFGGVCCLRLQGHSRTLGTLWLRRRAHSKRR
jgi:hypothetical protein